MRIRMIGILGTAGLLVCACGSTGGKAATQLRPPTPVNLSVYVSDSAISVSPSAVGAGPVVFIVTNQASRSVSLAISRVGQNHTIASTAPINPQGTTQVSVDFRPGDYAIATAAHGSTDASLAATSTVRSASIHIGHERGNTSSALQEP